MILKFDKYIKYINDCGFYVENLPEDEKYEQCAYFIKNAKNICFLTGAGISTNAGIPDFRSKTGWYSKEPEDILSFNNFMKNPREIYNFLYKYYKLVNKAEPTLSHKIISNLEDMGKNVTAITQNIDKLHEKAGSSDIIEYPSYSSFLKLVHLYTRGFILVSIGSNSSIYDLALSLPK